MVIVPAQVAFDPRLSKSILPLPLPSGLPFQAIQIASLPFSNAPTFQAFFLNSHFLILSSNCFFLYHLMSASMLEIRSQSPKQ